MLLLSLTFKNLLFWWVLFFILNLSLIYYMKGYSSNPQYLVNYYVFQEILGFTFLVNFLSAFVLLLKMGVSPFYFWLYYFIKVLSNFFFSYFMSFYKLMFLPVLVMLVPNLALLMVLGLVTIFLNVFKVIALKSLIFLSTLESFNWLVLNFLMSWILFGITVVFYFLLFYLLINNLNSSSLLSLEGVFFMMSLPLSMTFLVKVLSFYIISQNLSVLVLLAGGTLFLSVLSTFLFMKIFLLLVSKGSSGQKNMFLVFLLPLAFLY